MKIKINIKPTGKQHEAWEGLRYYNKVYFGGGAGSGKAQPLDAMLYTPSGPVTMGDIHPGDFVLSETGLPVRVLAVHERGILPVYDVIFSDGAKTQCCGDHLWTYWVARKKSRGTKTRSTRELIEAITKGKRHIIPLTQPVEFNDKELLLDPYTLGVLLGDGGLTKDTPVLSTADTEIISYIPHEVRKTNGRYSYNVIGVSGLIKKLGLFRCGSLNKRVPTEYLYNTREKRLDLLRGLMDTDGTVDKHGHISFSSISKQLALDVQFLIHSMGGKATITKKQRGYKKNGEYIRCNDAYDVYISIDNGAEIFNLQRKKNRCLTQYNGGDYERGRRITNIAPVGEKICKCITVASESGLYLTDNFIVTHNSWWLCETRLINCLSA